MKLVIHIGVKTISRISLFWIHLAVKLVAMTTSLPI